MKKTEYFALTGETVEVEMTKDEIAEVAQLKKEYDANIKAQKADAELKAAQKQAIADRLGITADELKTILG